MNLVQLEYFLAAVKERSFAAASRRAFVTPQTISKAVSELERELGQPLFLKAGRGCVPTPFALEFANRAENVINGFFSLKDYAFAASRFPDSSRVIRIAVASAGMRASVPWEDDLRRLSDIVPGVSIDVFKMPSEVCLSAFRERLVDAAIILGSLAKDGAESIELLSFTPSLLVSADNPIHPLRAVGANDLDGMSLARPTDMRHSYATLVKLLERSNVRPRFEDVEGSTEDYRTFFSKGGAVIVAGQPPLADRIEGLKTIPFSRECGYELSVSYAWRSEDALAGCLGNHARESSLAVRDLLESMRTPKSDW